MQISERRMMEFVRSSHFICLSRCGFFRFCCSLIANNNNSLSFSQSFILSGCGCVWFNFQVFYTAAVCSMWDSSGLKCFSTETEIERKTHIYSFRLIRWMRKWTTLTHFSWERISMCIYVYVWIGFPTAICTTNQLNTNNNNKMSSIFLMVQHNHLQFQTY